MRNVVFIKISFKTKKRDHFSKIGMITAAILNYCQQLSDDYLRFSLMLSALSSSMRSCDIFCESSSVRACLHKLYASSSGNFAWEENHPMSTPTPTPIQSPTIQIRIRCDLLPLPIVPLFCSLFRKVSTESSAPSDSYAAPDGLSSRLILIGWLLHQWLVGGCQLVSEQSVRVGCERARSVCLLGRVARPPGQEARSTSTSMTSVLYIFSTPSIRCHVSLDPITLGWMWLSKSLDILQ